MRHAWGLTGSCYMYAFPCSDKLHSEKGSQEPGERPGGAYRLSSKYLLT